MCGAVFANSRPKHFSFETIKAPIAVSRMRTTTSVVIVSAVR